MKQRIAIIDGVRTPFSRSGGHLKAYDADDLGAFALKALLLKTGIDPHAIDEVIFGNVAQPIQAANIARVIALKAQLPAHIPAFTVQRNCASGIEAITTAANKILLGQARIIAAGGTESMSNIPFLMQPRLKEWFGKLQKTKTATAKLLHFLSLRPAWFTPIVGLEKGLTDPICNLIMGKTAEVLAREFHISREEQDAYALQSHERACRALESGKIDEETMPVPLLDSAELMLHRDDGPRRQQTFEALAKLKPVFEPLTGSVTAGNSSMITDGAACVLLMEEKEAKQRGYTPLGYIHGYAYAALEGHRMGLGPFFAVAKLLDQTGLTMDQFALIEINEAFAAQVLANERAFASAIFAKEHLGRGAALGTIDMGLLNVNGGAIALGHPVGATGTRIVITLLKELRRRKKNVGLATLCVGGGQGAAVAVEVE